MRRKGRRQHRPHWRAIDRFVALLLFAVALGYFSLTLHHTFSLNDEGYLLHMSSRVARGEVPHRDFIDIYGPGVLSITSLALWLGDERILAVRWLLALFKAGAVVLTFHILRRLTPRGVAALGALLATAYWGRASINLNTPYGAVYTVPICLLALALLQRAGERRSPRAYLVVGCAAGLAILFKQSLGVMNAYALMLAIWASAMLDAEGKEVDVGQQPGRDVAPARLRMRMPVLLAWGAAAVAVFVPTLGYIEPRSYVLHILPIHLLMAVTVVGVAREGLGSEPGVIFGQRVLPYLAGLVLVLAPVGALYFWWGALPSLIWDMFILPNSLRNYFVPSALPSFGVSLFAIGGLALVAATLLALRERRAPALAYAGVGTLLLALAIFVVAPRPPGLYTLPVVWRTGVNFDWILSTAILLGAMPLIARAIFDRTTPESAAVNRLVLPLAFVQAFLCFQAFPRAGGDVWLAQAAMVPLLVYLGHRTYRWGTQGIGGRGRRVGVALACAAIPAWLVAPVVAPVARLDRAHALMRPIDLPQAAGIALTPSYWKEQSLEDAHALIAYLRERRPPDARLLLLGGDAMIYFLSGREHLVPEREYLIYLAALNMLPVGEASALTDAAARGELVRRPDTIVVIQRDSSAASLRVRMSRLGRFIAERYEKDRDIGPYRVLRRRDAGEHEPAKPVGSARGVNRRLAGGRPLQGGAARVPGARWPWRPARGSC
jgi:hypothetical protein